MCFSNALDGFALRIALASATRAIHVCMLCIPTRADQSQALPLACSKAILLAKALILLISFSRVCLLLLYVEAIR